MAENISSIGLTPVAEVPKAGGADGKAGAQGQSFTQLVEQFTTDAMETGRTGEQTSLLAAAKKAELVDVVTAGAPFWNPSSSVTGNGTYAATSEGTLPLPRRTSTSSWKVRVFSTRSVCRRTKFFRKALPIC